MSLLRPFDYSNIVADAFSFPTRATAVIAPENRTQMETAPAVRF